MKTIIEFVRLIRYGQARLSVAYHNVAVERAREGLAAALAARDAAFADIRIHDSAPPTTTVPALLRKLDTEH